MKLASYTNDAIFGIECRFKSFVDMSSTLGPKEASRAAALATQNIAKAGESL